MLQRYLIPIFMAIIAITFVTPVLGIPFLILLTIMVFIEAANKFVILPNTSPIDNKLANFQFMKTAYLKSDQWQDKRKSVLFRANFQCESCGSPGKLEIHHMSGYNKIPNEPLSDLACLCRNCHQYQHNHYSYPLTYEDYMEWNAPLLIRK